MLLHRVEEYLSAAEIDYLRKQAFSPYRRLDLHAAAPLFRALMLAPRVASLGCPTIPRRIVQYWNDKTLPNDVMSCVESWRGIPGFEWVLFDDGVAAQFIAETYSSEHLEAYLFCPHPSMKSDYFRYAYIYCHGGVYVDADNAYAGAGLSEMVAACTELNIQPLCRDMTPPGQNVPPWSLSDSEIGQATLRFSVNNDPIVAVPRSPAIWKALDRSTRLLLEFKRKGELCNKVSWTTGPDNLSVAIYDTALDAIASGIEMDISLLNTWHKVGPRKVQLEYRHTSKDWRTFVARAAT